MGATDSQFRTFFNALGELQSAGPLAKWMEGLGNGVGEGVALLTALNTKSKKAFTGADAITFAIENDLQEAEHYYDNSTVTGGTGDHTKQLVEMRAYLTTHIRYSRTDILQNKGDKLMPYVKNRIDNAKRGMQKTLMMELLGNSVTRADGTTISANGRPIRGLDYWVENQPGSAGTVIGGVTRSSTTTWLNNNSVSLSTVASLSTTILHDAIAMATHAGEKPPSLIIGGDESYNKLWSLADTKNAALYKPETNTAFNLGFPENLKVGQCTFIPEKYMTGSALGGPLSAHVKKLWILTPESFDWLVDPEDDMKIEGELEAIDSNTYVQKMFWSGQLICRAPRLNTVITWAS